jgi:hypothetical protein
MRFLELLHQLPFEIIRIRHHLASGDLFIARALETQFANTQTILRPHGWPKCPAGHRTRLVQLAQPRLRIEHWTWLVIRERRETTLCFLARRQHTSFRIAGKAGGKPRYRITCPDNDPLGALRFQLAQRRKPSPQSRRIELIDRKHPDAALCAARAARKPFPGTPRSIHQRRIHNLD